MTGDAVGGASVVEPTRFHFTYCKPHGDLCQGDVLRRTPQMDELLKAVHPHYLEPDYTHFVVLTQTCDLVRRSQQGCKSRYISLAAVRPLSLVVERAICSKQTAIERAAGVCSSEHKGWLSDFLRKLLNNNLPEYFYLHQDPQLNFPVASCAFLQLSISVRAHQHYGVCLDARMLSLAEGFRAKLGWLVGNLYSRVGTEDWVPEHLNSRSFDEMIEGLLIASCPFVDAAKMKEAQRKLHGRELDPDALRSFIEAVELPNNRKAVVDRVVKLLQEVAIDDQAVTKVRNRLENDHVIAAALARSR